MAVLENKRAPIRQKHQWLGWMFSGFLINESPVCVSEHGNLFSEGPNQILAQLKADVIGHLKNAQRMLPLQKSLLVLFQSRCCIAEASDLGNFSHSASVSDVHYLGLLGGGPVESQLSSATLCLVIFFRTPQGC